MEPVREKKPIRLTPKALLEKLETLQKTRKSKLNKAKNFMTTNRDYEKEVYCSFEKFIKLRDEAREMHNTVMVLLPSEEKIKRKNMLICNGFIDDGETWLSTESQVSNMSRESSKPSSKKSWSSVSSGRSSAASARVMAEKAAIIARATALKEKHALELQQEKLRHRQ